MKRRRSFGSSVELPCPFCGEMGTITIDEGGGEHQTFVDDCSVCCKPRVVHFESTSDLDGDVGVHVWLEREDGM